MSKRATGGGAHVAKICGADVELCNFILGEHDRQGSGAEAARAILAEIDGVADRRRASFNAPLTWLPSATARPLDFDPQDWGRKYLPGNGGCIYIDLNHVEVCLPEVRSAQDHVAYWRAQLLSVRAAQEAASARRGAPGSIKVLVNNTDGQDHSFGSHLDYLLTRECWNDLFERRVHHGLYLATYQVSSLVLTGQGKVGAENHSPWDGARWEGFQLSQRADFFETLAGPQTTYKRPILNTRDEPLCGGYDHSDLGLARLHCIFYDSNLCEVASLLKVGVLQVVLAMIEAGCVDAEMILDDPLTAVRAVSRDATLATTVEAVTGKRYSALDLQEHFHERASAFVAAGRCEGLVPHAEEIVRLWGETLTLLRRGDVARLAGRLDWVLKLSLLERVRHERKLGTWDAPELRYLDKVYASLDPTEGLYWHCEAAGLVERVSSDSEAARCQTEPPPETRAWTRAQLLRRLDRNTVEDVDWDAVTVNLVDGHGVRRTLTLTMADPRRHSAREAQGAFRGQRDGEDVMRALGATERERPALDVVNQPGDGGSALAAAPRGLLVEVGSSSDRGAHGTRPNQERTN